jgi:DNA-binding NtrC family response regulator
LLVVDLNAGRPTAITDIVDDDGVDIRTAVDASGAIRQCRLEYLDLVMINASVDDASGVSLLASIRTLRPTVRAVLMTGTHVPLRQMLSELRREPRHVPCFDEFQQIGPHAFELPVSA